MFNHYIRSKANKKLVQVNNLVHDRILDSQEASSVRSKIASKFDNTPYVSKSQSDEDEPPIIISPDPKFPIAQDPKPATPDSKEDEPIPINPNLEINEEFEVEWKKPEVPEPKKRKLEERTLWDPKRWDFKYTSPIKELIKLSNNF